MRKSKRFDRQIDDLLLTTATTLGMVYARRRIRRAAPKVLFGTGVLAAGTVAAATMIGIGTLGAGGAAAVWYRRRANAAAAASDWQAPPVAPRASFVDSHPQETAPIAAE